MPLAPCIRNEVLSVNTIIHNIHFAWHEQYLVKGEVCSAL